MFSSLGDSLTVSTQKRAAGRAIPAGLAWELIIQTTVILSAPPVAGV
jgi:hypothetical protein